MVFTTPMADLPSGLIASEERARRNLAERNHNPRTAKLEADLAEATARIATLSEALLAALSAARTAPARDAVPGSTL